MCASHKVRPLYCVYEPIDISNLLQRALTDILTFFSVPLNPLTSSTSLDLLVEYELFINTLYFTPLLLKSGQPLFQTRPRKQTF